MPQSVLVIDDSPLIHRLLAARLKDEDIHLQFAINGQAGLQMIRKQPPDLVLLDVRMPGLGGFEVCQQLKDHPETAPIPVIFLTGVTDALDKVRGFDLGAVDYITKPFEVVELRARVRAALRTVRYQKLLAQQAQIDGLTGLANRACFDKRLRQALSTCRRHQRSVVLVMADIDNFKEINDAYGHPFGDRVLESFGQVFREAVRAEDTACRYGGEEFTIVVPDTKLHAGSAQAERLRDTFANRKWRQKENEFVITASFGVAGATGTFQDLEHACADLIERADRALYRAKKRGRNCIAVDGQTDEMSMTTSDPIATPPAPAVATPATLPPDPTTSPAPTRCTSC